MSSRFDIENFTIDDSFIHINKDLLLPYATEVYVVKQDEQCRLDLIANSIYGTISLKTLLIVLNDIVDVSVVRFGYKLHYVPIQDIIRVLNEIQELE